MGEERTAGNVRRSALGRGLASLIPGADEEPEALEDRNGLLELPLDSVVPNPNQPRQHFDEEELEGLAQSLENQGLLQPIVVRRVGDHYELIAGERRWRASSKAGRKTILAMVKEADDLDSLVLALEENLQRQALNPLEEAHAYQQLVDDFGLTQEEVARKMGRERSTVANTLRLLRLPLGVQEDLISGALSMGHARCLLALENTELILEAKRAILEEGLSVRAAEALVAKLKKATPKKRKLALVGSEFQDPDTRRALEDLRQRFQTKVAFKGKAQKGKIELAFYSKDELNRLIRMLLR